jgi:hypothetical protein
LYLAQIREQRNATTNSGCQIEDEKGDKLIFKQIENKVTA